MNDLVIIFSMIAIIASIGAIICLVGGIASNRRWNKRFQEADLLKSINNHLKHIDYSLAVIAIAEHDRHSDPLNSIKLGLLSSPHARYVAFMKTLEGKTNDRSE